MFSANYIPLFMCVGFVPSLSQIRTLQEFIFSGCSTTGDKEKVQVQTWIIQYTVDECESTPQCLCVQRVPVHATPASLQPLACAHNPNRREWWEAEELRLHQKQCWNGIPALIVQHTKAKIHFLMLFFCDVLHHHRCTHIVSTLFPAVWNRFRYKLATICRLWFKEDAWCTVVAKSNVWKK